MKQNYSLSKSILTEIKKANKILINAHRNPDLDSVGSAIALGQALKKMGKVITYVCPHQIPASFSFINDSEKIKTVDFKARPSKPVSNWRSGDFRNFKNFIDYDLFLILDSGSYDIVTGSKDIKLPEIKKIIIDHHMTDTWDKYVYRLWDTGASATAEIVYRMLADWDIKIDENIATSLLSGIAGDTVFFKYPKNPSVTFSIVNELLKNGAKYDLLVEKFNDSLSFGFVKLLGEFLNNMKSEKRFVWSAIPYATFEKYGKPKGVREAAADSYFRSIKDIDFGVALLEFEPGVINMSFRSKKNFDVSALALKFGGGGHKNAAGATVKGEFNKTITNVIDKLKK